MLLGFSHFILSFVCPHVVPESDAGRAGAACEAPGDQLSLPRVFHLLFLLRDPATIIHGSGNVICFMEAAGDLGHKLFSHQMEDSGAQCNSDLRQPGPRGGGRRCDPSVTPYGGLLSCEKRLPQP